MGWGDAKKRLFALLDSELAEGRSVYQELMADTVRIDEVLTAGAERARETAKDVLARVREALGLR